MNFQKYPDGKDILKTLIELLEAQEDIKITYSIKEVEDERNTLSSSNGGA